jgi:uncharacterized membrane protein
MNHKHTATVCAALASVLALGLIDSAQAAEAKREKCYGIAKAGQNDCANLSGSHSCAGQSKLDMDPGEWRLVAPEQCAPMGGLSAAQAKARYAANGKKA